MTKRHYPIDWLRVLGMLMIFLFHTARYFDEGTWHVKNITLSFGMSVFTAIVSHFIMPLFFLLSAIAIYHALKKRTSTKFISERAQRLLIPLVVGIFSHVSLQVYIENKTQSRFSGSFWQFVPHYFNGWYGFGGNFAWMGLHLWYLLILFFLSFLLLPAFQYLNRSKGITARLADIGTQSIGPYLFIIPLFLIEWLVSSYPASIGRKDFGGWSLLTYPVFFISGYLLATDERYCSAIIKVRFISLFLSVLTVFIGYLCLVELGLADNNLFYLLVRSVNAWSWLLAFVGFAAVHLNFSNRFLLYANEAVLPFYIMHQTVIVVMGYFISDWQWHVLTKYLFLAVISFAITMALYEFAIRRIRLLGYICGMKVKPA